MAADAQRSYSTVPNRRPSPVARLLDWPQGLAEKFPKNYSTSKYLPTSPPSPLQSIFRPSLISQSSNILHFFDWSRWAAEQQRSIASLHYYDDTTPYTLILSKAGIPFTHKTSIIAVTLSRLQESPSFILDSRFYILYSLFSILYYLLSILHSLVSRLHSSESPRSSVH